MGTAVLFLVAMMGAGAPAPERIYTPEGWYQVEDGEGEAPDEEVYLVVTDDDVAESGPDEGAPKPAVAPEATPELRTSAPQAETARMLTPDCSEVRGRYLLRVLELHGVDAFALDASLLEAWTRRRPLPSQGYLFGGSLGDPALAALYGEPPVLPGALSFDLALQGLAHDLLVCEGGAAPAP